MLLGKDDTDQSAQHLHQHSPNEVPVARTIRTSDGAGQPRRRCTFRYILRVLIVTGIVLSIIGAALVMSYRSVFLLLLKNQLPVRRDSPTLPMFERPPADARATFYFFNLTNPDEVTYYGEKPVVEERGPYVYRLVDVKEDLNFTDDDVEVTYIKRKRYEFDREASIGDDSDTVVTLDFVAYGGFRGAADKGFERLGAALLDQTNRVKPFKSYRISELLWGAFDPLLKVFLAVSPGEPKPPYFGLMYGKNGTVDANFTVYTGRDDIKLLQRVKEFNGYEKLRDIWPVVNDGENDENYDANILRGTLGQSFPPDVNSESLLTVFAHDVCFAINFNYRHDSKTNGISTLRFGVDHELHRRLTGAINRVICDEDTVSSRRCAAAGLINVTKCRDGLPVVMSWPHFLETDYSYLTLVDGLEPSEEKHGPFVDVDPLTGMTLNGAKRIQLNFPLKPLPYETYRNLPEFTLFPVMWLEEAARVSPSAMVTLNSLIFSKYHAVQAISYTIFIVGIVLLASSVLLYFIIYVTCAQRLGNAW